MCSIKFNGVLFFIQENGTTWKEVLPNVKLFGNEGAIIQEAAKIQDAYY